jgi:hypothetical protein
VALIVEQGFNVKRGQEEAFQKWTEEADRLTKEASPPGVEYLGTYLVQFSSEKKAGEYRFHEACWGSGVGGFEARGCGTLEGIRGRM